MDPTLVFFIVRSLIRVGTATRDALEQKARDATFSIVLTYPVSTIDARFDEFFNRNTGLLRDLTRKPDGPLARYWIDTQAGGVADTSHEAYDALMSALGAAKRPGLNDNTSWISLRLVDEEALVGALDQWSRDGQPLDPWLRIALALADVGLDYVGSNPGMLGVGSSGETLLKSICANLRLWLTDVANAPQAFFVERMAAAIFQSGLQALVDNSGTVLADKAAQDLVGALAKPLADLFAKAVAAKDPGTQLALASVRDTVFPQMVAGGLKALADHQQEFLGSTFDPNDTVGFFTQGFLQALAQEPVSELVQGDLRAWVPVYQSMLKSVATKPNLVIKGSSADAKAFQSLIGAMADKLSAAPPPYTRDTAIDLGLVVVDQIQKELPSRTTDPWLLVVPSALQAVVQGLRNGGVPVATLAQNELTAVIRVILAQVAATPGMIVGNGSSVEVQAIVGAIATAMAKDDRFLISEDGWMKIAAAAASAAARNPGKLFKIDDATPEGQLATKLISAILTKASAGFGAARSGGVVLFGDTLVDAIEGTLTAAAGNATGALAHIDQIGPLVDQLNRLATSADKPIGAADWSWLFRNLIAAVFDKGAITFTDAQLRQMLFDRKLPES